MQAELQRLQGVLKKTIVFITHDFDEAIRLADRIAIMKDGALVQVGTPEELILHPATGYVAEFTRDVQRSKVMSVRSLMQPLNAAHTLVGTGARHRQDRRGGGPRSSRPAGRSPWSMPRAAWSARSRPGRSSTCCSAAAMERRA